MNNMSARTRSKFVLYLVPAILMFQLMVIRYGVQNILPGVVSDKSVYPLAVMFNMLGMCITTPIGGKLGDLFGRRKIVLFSMAPYMLSLVLCGFVKNNATFAAVYILMGASYGMLASMPNSLVRDFFDRNESPKYLSYNVTVQALSMIAGPIIAGFIADKFGAQNVFLAIDVPITVLSWLFIYFICPEVKTNKAVHVDFAGVFCIAFSVTPLLVALNFGGSKMKWTSPTILGLIAASIVFFFILAKVESKSDMPIISPKLFKIRDFNIACVIQLLSIPYLTVNGFYLVMYAQKVMHKSATVTGTFNMPMFIVLIISPFIGAVLAKKAQRYRGAFILAGVLISASGIVLSFLKPDSNLTLIYAGIALSNGVGGAITQVGVASFMQNCLPMELMGSGMSMLPFSLYLGNALSAAICGGILNNYKGNFATAVPIMYYMVAGTGIVLAFVAAVTIKTAVSKSVDVSQ